MRDLRKTLSTSLDHLHDLVFDRYDATDSIPYGASYTGTIYREGYLFKQSRKMWKFWKTRYFVLRNDGLLYFRSKLDKDGAPLGVISFRKLSVHLDAINGKGKPKYCLRLGSGHGFKTFYCLCCFSSEERNLWFTALLTAISEDMVTSYSLSKYRGYRTSSASSSDSAISESSSPYATLERARSGKMARTTSCDALPQVTDCRERVRLARRPSSLASLSELHVLESPQTSPKKSRKFANPLRRVKGLSALEFKGLRSSYIDLSNLNS